MECGLYRSWNKSKLIDQMIHLNCFVINSTDITIHLFRGICHSVHDTLNVALNGCDRGLEIMRNIADQFFVFFVQDKFFLLRIP